MPISQKFPMHKLPTCQSTCLHGNRALTLSLKRARNRYWGKDLSSMNLSPTLNGSWFPWISQHSSGLHFYVSIDIGGVLSIISSCIYLPLRRMVVIYVCVLLGTKITIVSLGPSFLIVLHFVSWHILYSSWGKGPYNGLCCINRQSRGSEV